MREGPSCCRTLNTQLSTLNGSVYRADQLEYGRHDRDGYEADDPAHKGKPLDKTPFVEPGPLWQAYETGRPTVVLIDEIDKAPRDFPNDLLNVLDQHEFFVPELKRTVRRTGGPPPVVVITSNSERRLPEPFLRRCVFHHIEFTTELLQRAVAARGSDFPNLPEAVREAAIQRFLDLRGREIRKKPATAELLVWLTVLAAQGQVDINKLKHGPLIDLPALSTLIKDRDDLATLR